MSHPVPPTWASVRPAERLADTPAVRRDDHWWFVSPTGSLPATDPVFTRELDAFAADLAAADRAVAHLLAGREPAREVTR